MKKRKFDSNQINHKQRFHQATTLPKINSAEFKKWRKERQVYPPKGGYLRFLQQWSTPIDLALPGDRVWWIGHSTCLIRINDKLILTDPIFSNRASPVQFVGPKRHTPPAITIAQLPQIDMIVISHNHYDHLDFNSIRRLISRFPNVVILVPQGLRHKLLQWRAKQVIELDWWGRANIDNMTFTSVPAIHWSRRGIFDTNKSLWCGWIIQANQKTVYFMGDSGYSPILQEIKQHFPSIDLGLIPIGAYAPRWFMHQQHIDPKQAIQLFDELNCKKAIGIHWGAFELADEPLDEPPELLTSLRNQRPFYALKMGESILIDD